MADYFGYDLFRIMNITDLEDKIILRARQNFLFDRYQSSQTDEPQIWQDLTLAWKNALDALKSKIAKLESSEVGNKKERVAQIQLLRSKLPAHESAVKDAEEKKRDVREFLAASHDAMAELLDKREGGDLEPEELKEVCKAHSSKWEAEFLSDLRALGCRMPDALTRVTEYVGEIIKMIETIIKRGYAYSVPSGSVYFDTLAFDGAENHVYGKLAPWSIGDLEMMEESEGKLANLSEEEKEKKNKKDFALWKASKKGEPTWDSPWGKGRPGWHIECSAMCCELLGKELDVHCGGWDLQFPHHENEVAQSEAFHDCKQWVNYFLHCGHLNIDSLKMSKSLKNFVSIQDILSKFTSKQLRMLFLLQKWDSPMNYQREGTMDEVDVKLTAFESFFQRVQAIEREASKQEQNEHWSGSDIELNDLLAETKMKVHEALCDDINTPAVIQDLLKLISKTNSYMDAEKKDAKSMLVITIAQYITKMLTIFGVIQKQEYGFPKTDSSGGNREEILQPILDLLTQFRTDVRNAAKEKKSAGVLYDLADKLRKEMAYQGIKIVDDDAVLTYSFVDKEELIKEMKQKDEEATKKRIEKLIRTLNGRKTKLTQAEKKVLTPEEVLADKFPNLILVRTLFLYCHFLNSLFRKMGR